MKRFWLKPNPQRDRGLEGTAEAAGILLQMGAELVMEEADSSVRRLEGVRYCSPKEAERFAQGVLVFGGDGTLLQAAHGTSLPLLGINFGHLGFITELKRGENEVFSRLLEDDFHIERRMMRSCVRVHEGKAGEPFHALNDVVAFRGGQSHMIRLKVQIDGGVAETYLADGLVVSTPTGSTAYALSAGGSILEPEMEAIEITPVCPHMLRTRPLVVSPGRQIRLTPMEDSRVDVSSDGVPLYEIGREDCLNLQKSDRVTRLIRVHSRSFYDILHEKLGNDRS